MNRLLVISALIASLSLVLWRGSVAIASFRRANAAEEELRQATSAVATIRELTPLPATAIAPEVTDAELLRDVQKAMAKAGVVSRQIREVTLDPEAIDSVPSAQSGASMNVLRRRTGRLSIQGITLAQLGAVLAEWQRSLAPLRIEQVRFQRVIASSGSENKFPVTSPPLEVAIVFATLTPEKTR